MGEHRQGEDSRKSYAQEVYMYTYRIVHMYSTSYGKVSVLFRCHSFSELRITSALALATCRIDSAKQRIVAMRCATKITLYLSIDREQGAYAYA